MQILKLIWDDLRRGENIDVYVTILAAIILAVLTIVELAPEKWIAPITLAVLAMLAITTLGNRYRLETILQKQERSSETVLLKDYPDSYEKDLIGCEDILIIGTVLSRTLANNYAELEKKLLNKHKVKILIVNPKGNAVKLASFRDYRGQNIDKVSAMINLSLDHACKLKNFSPENFEIRTIDYVMAFGALGVNMGKVSGVIYLEHYGFKMPKDHPRIVLKPKDGYWYEYFRDQLLKLWENAIPWPCDQHLEASD